MKRIKFVSEFLIGVLSKIIYHCGKLQRKKSPLLRRTTAFEKRQDVHLRPTSRRRRKGFQDDVDDKVADGLFGRCRNADFFPARYLFSFLPSCFQDRPKTAIVVQGRSLLKKTFYRST